MESYKLRIFTPRGLEREEVVSSVTLPSSAGEIGVLPKHTQYTGILGTGVLSFVVASTNQTVRAVVAGGFCTFADDVFTILADSIDTPESIDQRKYTQDREKLEQIVKSGGPADPQWVLANQKLDRIAAIDKLIKAEAH